MQWKLPYFTIFTASDGSEWELVVEKDPWATKQYKAHAAKLLLPYEGQVVLADAIRMRLESVILSSPSIRLIYGTSIDIVPPGLYYSIYVLRSQGTK